MSAEHLTNVHPAALRSEIERFASLIGHELRQPLATAMNLIGLLEDDLGKAPDRAQRQRLQQIRTLIDRTMELLVAQTTLHDAWPRKATLRAVPAWQLVAGALLELKPELERACVQLAVGPLPWLRVDPGLLQQVFRNLIENAVRYRRHDVPLEIGIHARLRTARDPVWEIAVTDNGRGFRKADAETIFAPFEQLEKESSEGQGLGLALCRRIAELHGGTITASGRPGSGAKFTLRLPRTDPTQYTGSAGLREVGARARAPGSS